MPTYFNAFVIPQIYVPQDNHPFCKADFHKVLQQPGVQNKRDLVTYPGLHKWVGVPRPALQLRACWALPTNLGIQLAVIVTPDVATHIPRDWFNRDLSLLNQHTGVPQYYGGRLFVRPDR